MKRVFSTNGSAGRFAVDDVSQRGGFPFISHTPIFAVSKMNDDKSEKCVAWCKREDDALNLACKLADGKVAA